MNTRPQPPLLENRYQVLSLLGQGGMGSVYLARDLRFQQRYVALKENHARGYASQAQFRQEAEVLARLRHPHLPRVTDSFVAPDGRQFLVMDCIEGVSLEEYVTRHGPATEEQARVWMDEVLDALSYLHGQSPPIIHRDIKPANIRITPAGEAVLVDFGLTKLLTPGALTASVVQKAGSPGYAPIEQYAGGTDQRSDVYGVGAAFYFAFTGQPPVEAPLRAAGEPMPRPKRLAPALSSRVDAALARALQVNAAERFQSAAELRTYLQGKSGPLEAGGDFARAFSPAQKKVLVGLLAALVVVVLALGGWMGWTLYGKEKDGGRPTAVAGGQTQAPPANTPLSSGEGLATSTLKLTSISTPIPTRRISGTSNPTTEPGRLATSTPKPTSTATPVLAHRPTSTPIPPIVVSTPTISPPEPPPAARPTDPPAPLPTPACPGEATRCETGQAVCENGSWVCQGGGGPASSPVPTPACPGEATRCETGQTVCENGSWVCR